MLAPPLPLTSQAPGLACRTSLIGCFCVLALTASLLTQIPIFLPSLFLLHLPLLFFPCPHPLGITAPSCQGLSLLYPCDFLCTLHPPWSLCPGKFSFPPVYSSLVGSLSFPKIWGTDGSGVVGSVGGHGLADTAQCPCCLNLASCCLPLCTAAGHHSGPSSSPTSLLTSLPLVACSHLIQLYIFVSIYMFFVRAH